MAAQNINPGHIAAFHSPTGARDDPRPAMHVHKSIMHHNNILIHLEQSQGLYTLIPSEQSVA